MSNLASPDLELLKYPVGRLTYEASPSARSIAGWIQQLSTLPEQMREVTKGLSAAQLDTPYRPEGWTIRQVVHHVPDSHMNAYIRTNWTLTEDHPTIKPYDQDSWAASPYSRTAPIDDSLDLLAALHARWIVVLRSLSPEQWQRRYYHPEDQRDCALSDLLQVYAWHSRHHHAHIQGVRQRNAW